MSARKAGIWLAGMATFGMLLVLIGCDGKPTSRGVVVAPPPANVATRDGIGVALVVDCSGSMGDEVQDNGRKARKEAIARRCVTTLIQRCEDFQTQNSTRVVELGLFKFDDTFNTALAFAKPNAARSKLAVASLTPGGGTAIGDAVLRAKEQIDLTGLTAKHIVVVTDGQNSTGTEPAEVAAAFKALPVNQRPAVYVIAFDTNEECFKPLKNAGWMVLSASNGKELQGTLDAVFGENILLEKP